jgi:hypothetical protein
MRRTILWLFIIALAVRLVAYAQHVFFGVQGIPFLPSASPWADFDIIYAWQLSMLQKGFVLYRDIPYSYPPLFIYTLYPFFIAAGKYGAAIPIVVADAASAPVIYLIASQAYSRKVASVAAVAYALSPLAIFNEGYLWLSSQPMTLFALLSVYFASRRQAIDSMVMLALAILFKQEALAVLPVVAVFLFRHTKAEFWKAMGMFTCVVVLASLPFVLLAPIQYASATSFISLGAAGPTLVPNYPSMPEAVPHPCTNIFVNAQFPSVAVCGDVTPNVNQLVFLEVTSAMQRIAQVVAPTLLTIAFPLLVVLRKRTEILQCASAYFTMSILLVFSIFVHQSLDYYLVPVYAFLSASSSRLVSVAIVAGIETLSMMSPGGQINLIIVIGCIIAVLVLQGERVGSNASNPVITNVSREEIRHHQASITNCKVGFRRRMPNESTNGYLQQFLRTMNARSHVG